MTDGRPPCWTWVPVSQMCWPGAAIQLCRQARRSAFFYSEIQHLGKKTNNSGAPLQSPVLPGSLRGNHPATAIP